MENNLSKAKGRKEKEKSKQQTKEKKQNATKQIESTLSKSQTPLGGYRKSS
jgi:hypothetical protein